ncbi:MAG: 1-acyl-sn-glycerol-3-phosphate acyltransferase [Bdellovibrionales bacterium]|nr:1-acyl-sn-glycerol-3-phosphate acyltransferase [Bdellovibrionales bacterium]
MNRVVEIAVFYVRLTAMLLWLVLSSSIAFPLALIRWRNAENNYLFGKIYGPISRAIMGIRVHLEGEEHLRIRPAIFVINHQSGIDMCTLSAPYPKGAVIIGKKELRRIPAFGLMFEAFGNVLIDRQDRKNALSGLNAAVAEMKEKNLSAWIFPEGTRNPSGEGLLPFKKGAFYMAIQSGSPIVPIVCSKLERLVNFEGRYARSGNIVIRALPPIETKGMANNQVERLLEATRAQMLAALAEVSTKAEAMDGGAAASRGAASA